MRRIEHAGFYREIISRKPPLIDEDGYEVDSEDDDERAESAMIAAAEFDPYADVRIENLSPRRLLLSSLHMWLECWKKKALHYGGLGTSLQGSAETILGSLAKWWKQGTISLCLAMNAIGNRGMKR
ncbi:hypothetical protein DH86_00003367 [Scytalidium sp. 3C]|nr:hypothetical protein DH86_00003367 [Scytalidium sp. 3C]